MYYQLKIIFFLNIYISLKINDTMQFLNTLLRMLINNIII